MGNAKCEMKNGEMKTGTPSTTAHIVLASYPGSRWVGKERAWYTLFAHTFNLPQDMETPGYFLILPCYVTSEFGLDNVSGYYNGV